MYVCVCVCVCMCACVRMCVYVRACTCMCLCVCVYQTACIRAALIWRIFVKFGIEDFTKMFRETTDLMKADNNIGEFTWRRKCVYTVDSRTKYFVARQQCNGNPFLRSLAPLSVFILLTATRRSTTVHTECIVAFSLQQWLGERATISLFMYTAIL
jgi:hypothetical protein